MRKIFGPYKGSKANGGRPIYVFKRKKKDGTVATTSSNKARVDYEEATGKKLPRGTEVDLRFYQFLAPLAYLENQLILKLLLTVHVG